VRWLPVTVAPHAHTDVGNDNTSGLSGTVGTEMLASMPFKTQKSSSVTKKKNNNNAFSFGKNNVSNILVVICK